MTRRGRWALRTVILVGLLTLILALPACAAGGIAILAAAVAGNAPGAVPASCPVSGDLPAGAEQTGVFTAQDGRTAELGQRQLLRAHEMIAEARASGADEAATLIMLIAAFQESGFRNYSNAAAYPESAAMTEDGDAHDEDSLGVLQQRPSAGWGEVAELMDPRYAVRAFLGGPDGPRGGDPPGLFDIDGWREMEPGEAAQAVQVSAHPDRYGIWLPAAQRLLGELGGTAVCAPPAGDAAYPLPEPAPITDGVGPRPCERWLPGGGCAHSTWHPALDFGAPCGVPVLAVRPGTVTAAANGALFIRAEDGAIVKYLHMPVASYPIGIGDTVRAGQPIGEVGDEGPSTGCHLDLRVDTGQASDPAVRALPRIGAGEPGIAPGHWVDPASYLALYGIDLITGGRS